MRRAILALFASVLCALVNAEPALLNAPFFPPVQTTTIDQRTLAWSELGAPRGRPLLFAVGFPHAASTGAGVLSPFDRYLRRHNLRLIAIERTGATRRSSFDISDTLEDYVRDVERLTAHLGVDRFSIMAFSAGGPGALAVAATLDERVNSVHLMSARGRYTEELAVRTGEQAAFEALIDDPVAFAPFFQSFPPPRFFLDPNDVSFLDTNFGTDFLDFYFATAVAELDQSPEGLSASRAIGYQPWTFAFDDVVVPVFVYQGWADQSIRPEGYTQDTAARVGGLSTVRFYPGESHFETHLKHFDQLVADVRYRGERVILCVPAGHRNSRTIAVRARSVARWLRAGAREGNCVWR